MNRILLLGVWCDEHEQRTIALQLTLGSGTIENMKWLRERVPLLEQDIIDRGEEIPSVMMSWTGNWQAELLSAAGIEMRHPNSQLAILLDPKGSYWKKFQNKLRHPSERLEVQVWRHGLQLDLLPKHGIEPYCSEFIDWELWDKIVDPKASSSLTFTKAAAAEAVAAFTPYDADSI